MVKKGSIHTATITDTVFPNKGVAYVDGQRIIVHDGRRDRGSGSKSPRSVEKKSRLESWTSWRNPLEKEAACAQFGTCGCTYLNVPYETQLEIKSRQVLKLLADAGIQGFDFLGIQPSPNITGYRNKMEYTFGDSGDGTLTLGLHKKRMRYEVSPSPAASW